MGLEAAAAAAPRTVQVGWALRESRRLKLVEAALHHEQVAGAQVFQETSHSAEVRPDVLEVVEASALRQSQEDQLFEAGQRGRFWQVVAALVSPLEGMEEYHSCHCWVVRVREEHGVEVQLVLQAESQVEVAAEAVVYILLAL